MERARPIDRARRFFHDTVTRKGRAEVLAREYDFAVDQLKTALTRFQPDIDALANGEVFTAPFPKPPQHPTPDGHLFGYDFGRITTYLAEIQKNSDGSGIKVLGEEITDNYESPHRRTPPQKQRLTSTSLETYQLNVFSNGWEGFFFHGTSYSFDGKELPQPEEKPAKKLQDETKIVRKLTHILLQSSYSPQTV